MIRPKHLLIISICLPVFVGGNSHAQGKLTQGLRYIPQTLKTPHIPAIINPQLPLQTQMQLARLNGVVDARVTQATLAPAVTAAATLPPDRLYPSRFSDFIQWMDQMSTQHLISSSQNTPQALAAVRQALQQYDLLPESDKPRINWLVISLNKLNSHIRMLPNGNLQRLVYRGLLEDGELPYADNFELEIKQTGIPDPFFKPGRKTRLWKQSLALSRSPSDKSIIQGITFFQGFSPQDAHQELVEVLRAVVPDGYQVRMGLSELGLGHASRNKFREGKLHLHIETATPLYRQPVPTSKSISLFISAKPYAGLIDVYTRQIIVPNNDQTIARNYLILFEPFLNAEAKQALQAIIEEVP